MLRADLLLVMREAQCADISRRLRIGINGFGRMGRLALRAGWGDPRLEFVHVNEIKGGPATAAHLLEFDSIHGRWSRSVHSSPNDIEIDGCPVRFTEAPGPGEIPWREQQVDIVLECSGKFRTPDVLQLHLDGGARKVIVAAPVKTGALNVVMGVNDTSYDPACIIS